MRLRFALTSVPVCTTAPVVRRYLPPPPSWGAGDFERDQASGHLDNEKHTYVAYYHVSDYHLSSYSMRLRTSKFKLKLHCTILNSGKIYYSKSYSVHKQVPKSKGIASINKTHSDVLNCWIG